MTTQLTRRPSLTLVPEPVDVRIGLPCQVTDGDLWFSDAPADLERAKRLCLGCPLRVQCLAGALEREEACGVWGGEIVEHGAVIPFKRKPGRPRKAS